MLLGQGKGVPHHCQTKSESAISRFLNHYKWSTRSLIHHVRSCILNLILSQRKKGRKPILEVILDLTTLEKVGNFPHLKNLIRVYHHKKGLHMVVMYLASEIVDSLGVSEFIGERGLLPHLNLHKNY